MPASHTSHACSRPRHRQARKIRLLAGMPLLISLLMLWTPAPSRAIPLFESSPAQRVASAEPEQLPRWYWPLEENRAVARDYVAPADRYSAGHRGIDFAAEPGTEIHAVAEGTVTFAGMVAGRPVLTLEHQNGWKSSYEPVHTDLQAGTPVLPGAVVGTLAEPAGHGPGSLLHLGARRDGEYVSPLLLLGAPGAVLLPWEAVQARG